LDYKRRPSLKRRWSLQRVLYTTSTKSLRVMENESYRVRESAVDHRNESTAARYTNESNTEENTVIHKELTHACTN
jgi:hypothetical protein